MSGVDFRGANLRGARFIRSEFVPRSEDRSDDGLRFGGFESNWEGSGGGFGGDAFDSIYREESSPWGEPSFDERELGGSFADFRYADLRGARFYDVDLYRVDLRGAFW